MKWKSWFDKENVEYIKEENGIRHIADIYFDGLILELQASAMSPPERRNRELFWGKNLRWIVKSQIDRFSFLEFVSRDVVSGYKRGITGEVKPVTRKKKTTPIGTEDIFDRLQRVGEYPIMWKWKNPKRWIIMKAPPVFYIDLTESNLILKVTRILNLNLGFGFVEDRTNFIGRLKSFNNRSKKDRV